MTLELAPAGQSAEQVPASSPPADAIGRLTLRGCRTAAHFDTLKKVTTYHVQTTPTQDVRSV